MRTKNIYDAHRMLGEDHDIALLKALTERNRLDEVERIENGLDYDEQTVRVSTVHARQDIVLMYYSLCLLDEKRNKFLSCIIILLFLIVAKLYYTDVIAFFS